MKPKRIHDSLIEVTSYLNATNLRKTNLFGFNTLKYKFMAVFGTKTEDIFHDTNKTLNSIFISANMLSTHYWQRQGRVKMEPDEFKKYIFL